MQRLTLKLIAVSLLFLAFSFAGLDRPLRSFALSLSSPLRYGLLSLGDRWRSEWFFFRDLRRVWQENLTLKEKIASLEAESSRQKELALENEVLRGQLKLGPQAARRQLLLARVVGRDIGPQGFFLLLDCLDCRQEAGFASGQKVIFKEFLVGQVSEVVGGAAKVRLIVDPQSRVAVLDQDSKNRARGIARGEFAMGLLLEKILPEQEVSIGDKVITSGEGGYPPGLLVGEVVEVSRTAADVLKQAKLKPLLDFYSLEKVFVVR